MNFCIWAISTCGIIALVGSLVSLVTDGVVMTQNFHALQTDAYAQLLNTIGEHLTLLGKDLKQEHGKGFSKSNLNMMRQFYIRYPDFDQLSTELSWSIYCELLVISDDLARSFYEKQCILENWSVKELKRQINTSLFERLALSRSVILRISLLKN